MVVGEVALMEVVAMVVWYEHCFLTVRKGEICNGRKRKGGVYLSKGILNKLAFVFPVEANFKKKKK